MRMKNISILIPVYEETAALLALPIGTVKTHLFRARKELVRLASREGAMAGTTEE